MYTGDPSRPGSTLGIELRRYDTEGNAEQPEQLSLPVGTDKNAADIALTQAVRQSRGWLEKEWRQEAKGGTPPAEKPVEDASVSMGDEIGIAAPPQSSYLPVVVPIDTLAEWERIRQRMVHIPLVVHAEIITLARGSTNIEIEFRGNDPEQLRVALLKQNLSLTQDTANGVWLLQPLAPGGTY